MLLSLSLIYQNILLGFVFLVANDDSLSPFGNVPSHTHNHSVYEEMKWLFMISSFVYCLCKIEGAYLEGNKSLSNWDVFSHIPGR